MSRTPQPDDDIWLVGDGGPGIVLGVHGALVSILWPVTAPQVVTWHHLDQIEHAEPFR